MQVPCDLSCRSTGAVESGFLTQSFATFSKKCLRTMAVQRLIIAKITGDAGRAVLNLFAQLRQADADARIADAVDRFCENLRANAYVLPVIYYSEWIDRWLMGDSILLTPPVEGKRFQACCMTSSQALERAAECRTQFPEQEWLSAHLREAAESWKPLVGESTIVLLREVFGPSTLDEEITASLQVVPDWIRCPST